MAICDTDGLIGICFIPKFLGGLDDINRFLDYIDYAVKKFGAGHVAIGPDVSYVSRNENVERAKLKKPAEGKTPSSLASARWEHRTERQKELASLKTGLVKTEARPVSEKSGGLNPSKHTGQVSHFLCRIAFHPSAP